MPVIASCAARNKLALQTCSKARRWCQRMLHALRLPEAELSLLICGDELMQRLNRDYRGKDRPTDVLAFAMSEGKPLVAARPTLGDVVISWQTARRQAADHGVSYDREVCLLLAHGLLHLLGDDHRTRRQERRMAARTHMLMAAALGGARGVEKNLRRSRTRPARR